MPKKSINLPAIPTVRVLQCPACGRLDAGTREVCSSCYHRGLDGHHTEGTGILQSWTVIRRPPSQYADVDHYTVAVIALDAGPRISVRLADTPEDLAIGDRMQHVLTTSNDYDTFERAHQ
jgi:uncharacterized OB-fold protein